MGLQTEAKNWYRDRFLVSTEKSLIQVDAINEAMGSELMPWAQNMPREALQKALDNSLCLGLYELPRSTAEIAGQRSPRQIGLARVITDDVTFAYLTDVYVIPAFQGIGLGRWLLECLKEVIDAWPHLRRFMFLTSKLDLYRKTIGAKDWDEYKRSGLVVGHIGGPPAPRYAPE
ncbi:hypothetical protein F5Y17DRAFT_393976 [Xylariaceae sp. FL0594]|nr:hypothetical protein F5Y17DRAFT_393976 [Xylariaceae sp. FL0594]